MLKRVFITGASGLLGLNLALQKWQDYKYFLLENDRKINLPLTQNIQMDLSDCSAIEAGLKLFKPEIVIHSAGMTNVDGCEADPSRARFINGLLAGNVAKVSHELGIKFVHISTDHLFDGSKSFVSENTSPNPVNAYGFSKALGEELVVKNNSNSIVVRCNFFGWGPSYKLSFSDFIINKLTSNESIKLVGDVYYTPASTVSLIEVIKKLVAQDVEGVFNAVGRQRISKYEFGLKLARIFSLPTDLIEKIELNSLGVKAERPRDMSLSDNKIRRVIGHDLGTVEKNIYQISGQIGTELHNRIKAI